ncbi:MAG TPA: hypothetical protein VE869_03045 [Gemmatimonas sp.]|nr:hypothetical protein [Gemmatimonas sp.]
MTDSDSTPEPTAETPSADRRTPLQGDAVAAPGAGGTKPPVKPSLGRRHWGKLSLLAILGIPLLGMVVWAIIGLNWTYSSGDRPGTVAKISRKGWVCKTWEGTLYTDMVKGFQTDSFNFTVRDDSLAAEIGKLSGKRVAVHYEQHNLVPTKCFGDSEYFVTSVRALPE